MIYVFKLLGTLPILGPIFNRLAQLVAAAATPSRPHRFTLWSPSKPTTPAHRRFVPPLLRSSAKPSFVPIGGVSDYVSWPGLVDRTFTARHLPPRPVDDPRPLPEPDAVVALFDRQGDMAKCSRSSVLFCFFAQWFTDSFLRTHPYDLRRTTSNHEIDLCQIYGLDEPSTWALRAGKGGLLKSRHVNGQEYPCLLYKNGQLDDQFFSPDPVNEVGLTYLRGGRASAWEAALNQAVPGATTEPRRRDFFYASGLDRGGSTIVYSAFNTIFLREHNRIARLLEAANPAWTDDRLFETARLVNIRQVLGVVINDYIAHISDLPFRLDRTFAEGERWYRTNRISFEFDLLYRWHSLSPDAFILNGTVLGNEEYRFNNQLLEQHGVERVIDDASKQPAGAIGLFNTPKFLWPAEKHGLLWAREFRIEGFNAYRTRFGLKPYARISDFAANAKVADALERLYGTADAVEFTVGLFAEKYGDEAIMGETIMRMVAYDAFTHILTNPVLATEINCVETFSSVGWEIIGQQASLAEIVRRNCDPGKQVKVSLAI